MTKVRMSSRSTLWLSGLSGLILAAVLTIAVVGVVWYGLPPLVVSETGRLVLLVFVLCFSVMETPLMIVALRRILASSPGMWLPAVTHSAFVFFAAFYAAPYTLLTGQIWIGVALAALSLVRLTISMALVRGSDGDNRT